MSVDDPRNNWNLVQAEFTDRVCDVCGSDDSHELLAARGTAYHECNVCGLIYSRPIARNLGDINESNYAQNLHQYSEKVERQRKDNMKRLQMFEPWRQTGNFVEIGCNAGIVIAAARELGWHEHGVDISRAATDWAREKLGLNVYCGTLEAAAFPDDHFDVVYSNSVMEHLEHPFSTLKESLRILRPGGVFFADTVNWDSYTREILGENWRYIDPIDHVHLFTPDNVRTIAARAGFDIERIWTTGARVVANQPGSTWHTPWYLHACKGLLSLATRFTLKGDAIKFLLTKPAR